MTLDIRGVWLVDNAVLVEGLVDGAALVVGKETASAAPPRPNRTLLRPSDASTPWGALIAALVASSMWPIRSSRNLTTAILALLRASVT